MKQRGKKNPEVRFRNFFRMKIGGKKRVKSTSADLDSLLFDGTRARRVDPTQAAQREILNRAGRVYVAFREPRVAVRFALKIAGRSPLAVLDLEHRLCDVFVRIVKRRTEEFLAVEEIAERRLARLHRAEDHHDEILLVLANKLLLLSIELGEFFLISRHARF